jgi:hypothetical protein
MLGQSMGFGKFLSVRDDLVSVVSLPSAEYNYVTHLEGILDNVPSSLFCRDRGLVAL